MIPPFSLTPSEWAIKSMQAGKHVLIEKPLCANAQEAQDIFQVARETNKIALEAFHWRFHPAAHEVKKLIDGGEYGRVTRTYARMVTPKNSIPGSDIRWKWKLGGGALMDEVSSTFLPLGGRSGSRRTKC
jgi:predicted dehydrogenase